MAALCDGSDNGKRCVHSWRFKLGRFHYCKKHYLAALAAQQR